MVTKSLQLGLQDITSIIIHVQILYRGEVRHLRVSEGVYLRNTFSLNSQ